MTQIVNSYSKISDSNGVFIISQESEREQLDFLKLDKKVDKAISEALKKKKDTKLQFFVWTKNFENIYILILHSKKAKPYTEFLGKTFRELPDALTLFVTDNANMKWVIDTYILSRYNFDLYKTKPKKQKLLIVADKNTQPQVQERLDSAKNVALARDLWETPSNILTPEEFAKRVKKTKFDKVSVTVLSPKDVQQQGLGLLQAVGKWSIHQPYMVIMERIVDPSAPVYGIVGKWITFDTWGIQVKPENMMYEMKGDMWGAAVTFWLMKELDRLDVQQNFVACLCLAENTISANAYKPSDIITGYTGKTVEVIHTDAEGRLVLADGISYLWKNYTTSWMMTIATLTWAVMVALGHRYAGIMGTDRERIKKFVKYSDTQTEQYVELPFDDYFLEKTKSEIADYKNLDRKVHAWSSMGAAFLANFLENKEPYTHIDIAGVYLNWGEPYGKVNSWATGFWVESISEILSQM